MKKKVLSLVLATAMVAMTLTGCGNGGTTTTDASTASSVASSDSSSADTTTTTGETIKVGTISPNTGSMAAYGDAVTKAWKLAAKEINAAGGVNGSTIEIVEKDDQMDATETLKAFNALIADGVTVI